MQLTPINDNNDTKRRTGNQAWTAPTGDVSGEIAHKALALKSLIQRDMAAQSVERANSICNALLADADAVARLETRQPEGGCHG